MWSGSKTIYTPGYEARYIPLVKLKWYLGSYASHDVWLYPTSLVGQTLTCGGESGQISLCFAYLAAGRLMK